MLPVASEINPIATGANAPPIMAITIKDAAIFVSSPKSLIPKAKIVGNIIDIKNGTPTTAYKAICPDVRRAIVNNSIVMDE